MSESVDGDMDDGSLADLLERFGLSEKEVDTYLALLEHGEAKASTIADSAGVSKRYVYSVSEELERRGLVEVKDHVVPTTIRAHPPDKVVESLRRDVDAMGPALEARYSRSEPAAEQFEVVKARVTAFKRVRSLVEGADEEVALSIPYDYLDEVSDQLHQAVDRGVLVLLVVTDVDAERIDGELAGVASVVRAWREPMPTMLTVDRRTGVVAPTEMVLRPNSDAQAIVFSQPQLGPVMVGSFFGNYWPSATEVHVSDPAPLPAAYTDFRQAVFQATLHHRAGTDLSARVEGHYVGSGEDAEIHGRVVETTQGLVEPATNTFPVENSLTIEHDDERVSVGGEGAFVEDFEARRVVLESE